MSRSAKRVIAVVTGSRAEFGLLAPVMRAIAMHPRLKLRVIVTGTHLVRGTWRDIAAAGFGIDARVRMQKAGAMGGNRAADVAALGRGVIGIVATLQKLKPDVVVVLGDRIEALAAACAASVGGFHLAHIHGGDRAEGVADEAMRHAISKLAHVHFAATALSRARLVRMGEVARAVFRVGSPAVDGLREVAAVKGGNPFVIVAQHPIGAANALEKRWMLATLRAVKSRRCLVFAPNADPGSAGIRAALRQQRIQPIEHLPRPQFLSLLRGADAIVGNSSAGLIEAAALRVPCVNIGPRQAGREKPGNVVDCDYGPSSVAAALRKALRLDLRRLRHPYGDGSTGRRIAAVLARLNLESIPLRKRNSY